MQPSQPSTGAHYSLIKQKIPPWLLNTSVSRAEALRATPLAIAPWHANATTGLRQANARAWTTQNDVDARLHAIQDVYGFAAPLLSQALTERYGLHDSVKDTYLYLHTATGTVLKGSTSRTVSLLDAALHNFARSETFSDSSCYISRPNARGHFDIKPLTSRISIEQFVRLCRELDLGARYQRHLQTHLMGPDLQPAVIASQKAALDAAAHMALARQDISAASFHQVQRTLRGERGVMQFYALRMHDTVLTGPLLIAADLDKARANVPITVYLPHDSQAPLKDYPSIPAFMDALNARLKSTDYRRDFSQFVDQQQRGHFFSALQQGRRVTYGTRRIERDLWPWRYQQALDKIFNDARERAVSTADSDSRARWAWWDNVSKILDELLNVGLLVVTPFVPFLGELMLAYTAYQLLDEVVEGVVDLAEGQALEATAHLVGVVSDVVQLGALGVAGKLVPSAFIDQLKPVKVNGHTRLWNPDLRPYALQDEPAPGARDALGLHQQQTRLTLAGMHYAVQRDANDTFRIQHPTRPEAYAPRLDHNGDGAWRHEGEDPRSWDDATLLRRLGHSLDHFSDAQLEQARVISATESGTLRAVHADNNAPPPLLMDSLKRLRLNDEAQRLPDHLRAGKAVDQDTYWSPHMATELPGWPADQAIDVYEDASLSGSHQRYGASDARQALAISRMALNEGKLAERLVDSLDERHLHALLPTVPAARTERIQALREHLADQLAARHRAVFDYLYGHDDLLNSADGVQVRSVAPDLPASAVTTLLAEARPAERATLRDENRVPLRLAQQARELAEDARQARAQEGLHLPPLFHIDSERLIINTLKWHTDAFGDLRLEVREHSRSGHLRCSAGPEEAATLQVLVRDENAHYRLASNAATDFYSAVLQALPAAQRERFSDGDGLRRWVIERTQTQEARRNVLLDPTPARRETQRLVQRPRFKWVSRLLSGSPPSVEQRVRALYPRLRGERLNAKVQQLDTVEGRQALAILETEKKTLIEDLDTWIQAPTRWHGGNLRAREDERLTRTRLKTALCQAWENSASGYVDYYGVRHPGSHLDLEGWPLGSHLHANTAPRSPFPFVTSLSLVDSNFGDEQAAFLDLFPNLVALELAGNHLTRLPHAISAMPHLSLLGLGNNPLRWNPARLARLSSLTHLRALDLSHNRRLTTPPDVGAMRHLRELYLANTGIREWPEGLFEHTRSSHFHLDLQNTAIDHVPQFLPWQPEADLVARTRLDRNRLTLENEERMVSYRLASGLDPYRHYPPRGLQDSAFWLRGLSDAARAQRQQQWDELEQEHNSQGFFEVLRGLQPPDYFENLVDQADYNRNRAELTANVWRMLDAIHADEPLRRRFFVMAGQPGNCADASAQIFNNLGVQTLLHETWLEQPLLTPQAFTHQLANLARQVCRLNAVTALAEDEVARRIAAPELGGLGLRLSTDVLDGVPGTVDEVQVHAAYQTGLKHSLDLPWLASHMVYRETADVDAAMLERAYHEVLRGERGDGLADRMLEVSFWEDYLHVNHAEALASNLAYFQQQSGLVDDLQQAQHAWAKAEGTAKQALRPAVQALADTLGLPHNRVFTEEPMSDLTYKRLQDDLAARKQALARQLTRQALNA